MAFRILLRTSSLVMWSLYEMPRRRLKLLISTVCIFLSISAVNVQVSQEYKKGGHDQGAQQSDLWAEVYVLVVPDDIELCECCYGLGNPGAYFRHGSFVSDYDSQIFEALNGFHLLAIDPDVTADVTAVAIGVADHLFGLLSTDLHAVCGRSLIKVLH